MENEDLRQGNGRWMNMISRSVNSVNIELLNQMFHAREILSEARRDAGRSMNPHVRMVDRDLLEQAHNAMVDAERALQMEVDPSEEEAENEEAAANEEEAENEEGEDNEEDEEI